MLKTVWKIEKSKNALRKRVLYQVKGIFYTILGRTPIKDQKAFNFLYGKFVS